jgi:hypothetical protein
VTLHSPPPIDLSVGWKELTDIQMFSCMKILTNGNSIIDANMLDSERTEPVWFEFGRIHSRMI